MPISTLAYWPILGKPLIFYLGVLTLTSLLFTALIAFLQRRGVYFLDFNWHFRMARITITLAIIHGLLALSIYLF